MHLSDVTIDLASNNLSIHGTSAEDWKVTLVDTGLETQTGGRIRKIRKYLDDDDFCLTYGDGVSDINIKELIDFHRNNNHLATLTAVQPPGRY